MSSQAELLGQSRRLYQLAFKACKTDDVSIMAEAISLAPSLAVAEQVIRKGLSSSVRRDATHVLSYLLDERGADVKEISTADIYSREDLNNPSRDMLDVLVSHGWNVNTRGPHGCAWPLIWYCVRDSDLLDWCLDHGARVDLQDDPATPDVNFSNSRSLPPILEIAAKSGTVANFERLRAKGAPLSRRLLHQAVESAVRCAPKVDASPNQHFQQRMDMVRYLVDKLEFDVNSVVYWPGTSCGTPLCHVAYYNRGLDVRELVWFLLDRGADPNQDGVVVAGYKLPGVLECAKSGHNQQFLKALYECTHSKIDLESYKLFT